MPVSCCMLSRMHVQFLFNSSHADHLVLPIFQSFRRHQPSGGAQGQATDIEIHAREILKMRDTLNTLYNRHTGQPTEQISRALERDFFMTADEAQTFGVVDEVIRVRPAEVEKI